MDSRRWLAAAILLILAGLQRDRSGAAFAQTAAAQPITFVSADNLIAKNSASWTGANRRADRWPHYLPQATVQLIPSFYNWTNAGPTGTTTGQPITVLEASLEYAGKAVTLTRAGAASWTIADGANDIQVDPVPASAFGLARFPAGAIVWTKTIIASAGAKVPFATVKTTDITGSQSLVYNGATTTMSTTRNMGLFAATGTAPVLADYGFRPLMLGRLAAPSKVYAVLGDSITEAFADYRRSIWGRAWFQRAMEINGTPSVNFAVAGSLTGLGGKNARITALLAYANRGVIFYGTNDIGKAGNGPPATSIVTSLGARINQMKAGGITIIGGVKLLPRTDSTDEYASTANQLPYPGWGTDQTADQVNTQLAAIGLAYVVPANSVRSSDPHLWPVNGKINYPTGDGTHPSQALQLLLAKEAAPLLASK
jgi:hypothetical protein